MITKNDMKILKLSFEYDRHSIASSNRKYLGKVKDSEEASERIANLYEGQYGLIDISLFPWSASLQKFQGWKVKEATHIFVMSKTGEIVANYLILENNSIYAMSKNPKSKSFGKW